MQRLPDIVKNHGYLMKQIKRTDKIAMYSKAGGFEVMLIQKHHGYEINGIKIEPKEYLPKDEDFGRKGWYFGGPDARERAKKKFAELEKTLDEPENKSYTLHDNQTTFKQTQKT